MPDTFSLCCTDTSVTTVPPSCTLNIALFLSFFSKGSPKCKLLCLRDIPGRMHTVCQPEKKKKNCFKNYTFGSLRPTHHIRNQQVMNEALPPETMATHALPQEEIIPAQDESVYNFYWPSSALSLED